MNGFLDIVIMGDQFPQKNSNFMRYADLVRQNLLKREPFATRKNEIRFHFIEAKGNLGCNYGGMAGTEVLTCDLKAIKRALGNTPVNIVHIIAWKDGGGGSDGAQISATGCNQASDVNAQCFPFEARAFDAISPHEMGHSFGLPHDFIKTNHVMWFATNGGCELVGTPYLPEHQTIINSYIDKAKLT